MRRLLLLIYALIFVDEIVLLAIVPLTPIYGDELGLSKVETGVLLSASSVTTVATSIPIGLLSDRVGARRRTSALGAVMAVAGIGGVVGPGFAGLVAEHAGTAVPFVATAIAAAAVTV